jgi:hypothetical protein
MGEVAGVAGVTEFKKSELYPKRNFQKRDVFREVRS